MSAEGSSSASSSASDSTAKAEAIKKASELLAQGKRNMLCGEVPKAVNVYEEAVQLLVQACGELSRDCADAYFSCGCALLELGRMETSVLGAALDGVEVAEEKEEEANEQFEKPPESDGEERQQLREKVYEAMSGAGREEESKKTVLEKSKKSCTEGDVEACDKSEEPVGCEAASEELGGNHMEVTEHCGPVIVTEGQKDCLVEVGSNNVPPNEQNESVKKTEASHAIVAVATEECKKDECESECTDTSGTTVTVDTEIKTNDGQVAEASHGPEKNEKSVGESKLQKQTTDDVNAAVGKTNHTSEDGARCDKQEIDSGTEKPVNCDDVEMADKDAADEAEEEADEDEEENIAEDKDVQEGEEIGEEKEEDVPNFQLAWEYLDLAKVIYLKSESAEDQLKAAECYIKLGELSMETEQHVTAAEDIESALKIQQKLLPSDDRLIAETHYQLGLAYGLGKEFKLSIQHYTDAVSVIEAKIASLNRLVEKESANEDNKENCLTDLLKKYQDEIKELQELIPEMRTKIEDAQEEEKDTQKMKQMAIEALGFSGPSKTFESPKKRTDMNGGDRLGDVDENGEKKATDIAHLVRKKRKPENESPTPNDQGVKKIRHDECSFQDSAAESSKVNGSSETSDSAMLPSTAS